MKETPIYAANEPRHKTDCFYVNETNAMKYHGFMDRIFDYVEKTQLLRTDLWKRFVQQFKEDADYEGGWRGEYWGKMVGSAAMAQIMNWKHGICGAENMSFWECSISWKSAQTRN